MQRSPTSQILHASCVALAGRGLLILGASGSGKSSLSLQLMALGADLVADDRVCLWPQDGQLLAQAPERIAGVIEARGLGLLRASFVGPVALAAAVDLDVVESSRLPALSKIDILGQELPAFKRLEAAHFVPALLQFLKAGALDPDAAFK